MFVSILFFILFYSLSSKEDQKLLNITIVIAIAIGILFVAFGPRPANATSCYKAFQNAATKQERTIKYILDNCEIAPRANFAGDQVYAEHLEVLYYFVEKVHTKNKFSFSATTNKKLTLLLSKLNKLHLCYKGHKEECPVVKKKSLKEKPTLHELERKMETTCERNNNSFACKHYYQKILLRIERWDFE